MLFRSETSEFDGLADNAQSFDILRSVRVKTDQAHSGLLVAGIMTTGTSGISYPQSRAIQTLLNLLRAAFLHNADRCMRLTGLSIYFVAALKALIVT
jgi:hypothetical protein